MPRLVQRLLKQTGPTDDVQVVLGHLESSSVASPAPAATAASTPPARVLVVDDVRETRVLAELALRQEGISVDHADTGPLALSRVAELGPDLVLLDIDLPGMNGLEVLTRLRRDGGKVAVILVSGHGAESERVLGLELGADDYVVKPFSPRELAARVRSVLRRSAPRPAASHIVAGPLQVYVAERRVVLNGEAVELTPKEFDLLSFLVSSEPARVFSRHELLQAVWGSSAEWQDSATVTEHVRRLRLRIEVDPARPQLLQTVRGVGYRFDPSAVG